ncbi:hypothetical protein SEA_KARDASHIAN_56 [Streptomyces phage Kardashian]|nr:hypothetical protein SEA_KARDASHIAN_56 [Streptomyces phage Kardashian]
MIEMVKYLLCIAGGAMGGIAIGYSIATRRHEADFIERLDKATDDAKDFYRRKYEKKAQEEGEDPEFTKAAIRAAEALQEYQGITIGPSVLAQELTESFRREEERAAEEDEDPEDEEDDESPEPEVEEEAIVKPPAPMMERRIIPGQPKPPLTNYNQVSTPPKEKTTEQKEAEYVPETISKDDFINGVSGLNQSTVTYFQGDHILANERDQIITDEARRAILGTEIEELLKAGPEAMGGETTLYIRNTQVGREIEIVWSSGAYSDEVGDPIYASG